MMKRILIMLAALVAVLAFTSGTFAAEKKAAAPKASGTVVAYEAGKMITIKGAKDKELAFDIAPDAAVKGDVKEGAKVTVTYKKDGDKMVATSIAVPAKRVAKAK